MLLRVGAHDPEVAKVHQALLERGALPPAALVEAKAGEFGPATEGAVQTFQAKIGLVVDGVIGPKTWAALMGVRDGGDFVGPPDYEAMAPLPRLALELADQELRRGVAEQPVGSNRGREVDAYLVGRRGDGREMLCALRFEGKPCPKCDLLDAPGPECQGAQWCARFALWCVEGAARQLGVASPTAGLGGLASAQKWRDRAISVGRWRDTPAPGRVGVIIVPAAVNVRAHGHVLLVAGVNGACVSTREGNSANRVAARSRFTSEFAGFVELG